MIHFVYPYLFWILVVPFIIFAILISTNKDKIERLFSIDMLKILEVNSGYLPIRVRNIVFFSAIFMIMIALARPVTNEKEQNIQSHGLKAILAIDISGSMRCSDNYPSRLEFAKQKAKVLLNTMINDDVSLLAFAGNSFVVSPYTDDKFALVDMIDGINSQLISDSATNYDSLADLIIDRTQKNKQKIAIVISDGGDANELSEFKAKMQSNDIKLFVILVGTAQGSPVLDRTNKPIVLRDGTVAITKQNDALGEIALETDGAYIKAAYNNNDVIALANKIDSLASNDYNSIRKKVTYKELFYIPLSISLFLLLLSFISLPSLEFKKRSK